MSDQTTRNVEITYDFNRIEGDFMALAEEYGEQELLRLPKVGLKIMRHMSPSRIEAFVARGQASMFGLRLDMQLQRKNASWAKEPLRHVLEVAAMGYPETAWDHWANIVGLENRDGLNRFLARTKVDLSKHEPV